MQKKLKTLLADVKHNFFEILGYNILMFQFKDLLYLDVFINLFTTRY